MDSMSATPTLGSISPIIRTPLSPSWSTKSPDNFVKASESQIFINLVASTLGAGILSLPWGMAGSSLITGVFALGFNLLLTGCAIMLYIRAAERTQLFDVGSVMSRLPGKVGTLMQWMTNLDMGLAGMCCLLAYNILVGDSLSKVFPSLSRKFAIMLANVVILPICFLPQKWLAVTSSLSVLVNIYLFLLILYEAFTNPIAEDVCYLGFQLGSASILANLFMATCIQYIVFPMYYELEDRSPEKFQKLLIRAFSMVFLFFGAFAGSAYLRWGSQVSSNILLSFPRNGAGLIAQFGVCLIVLSNYPIMTISMVQPLQFIGMKQKVGNKPRETTPLLDVPEEEHLSLSREKKKPFLRFLRPIAIVTLVVVMMFASFYVTQLGSVNVFTGSMMMIVFLGFGPGLTGMFLLDPIPGGRIIYTCLIIFALVMSMTALALKGSNYVSELESSCLL